MLPGCEVNGPLFARIKQAVGPLDLYGLEWPVCLDLEQAQGRSQRHAMVSLLGLAVAGKDEPFVPCEEVGATHTHCCLVGRPEADGGGGWRPHRAGAAST